MTGERAAARDRTVRDNGPNEGGCLCSAVSCCGSWVFDARKSVCTTTEDDCGGDNANKKVGAVC